MSIKNTNSLAGLNQTTVVRRDNCLLVTLGVFKKNTTLVKEVSALLTSMEKGGGLSGGGLILLTGECTLPVMAVVINAIAHAFSAVAVFDPKLKGYVVSITHDPKYEVGELLLN